MKFPAAFWDSLGSWIQQREKLVASLVLTTECSTGGVSSNMRIGHPLKMKVYSWEIHLPSGNLLQFAIENTP
jgi:hypothetical protein